MENAGVTLKGVSDTTLKAVGDILGQGLEQGLPYKDIADSIYNSYAFSYERAQVIATTEGNRAAIAATMDSYTSAGISQWDWNTYDPCDECAAMGEANPHDVGDDAPPLHPNCECFVTPVIN